MMKTRPGSIVGMIAKNCNNCTKPGYIDDLQWCPAHNLMMTAAQAGMIKSGCNWFSPKYKHG